MERCDQICAVPTCTLDCSCSHSTSIQTHGLYLIHVRIEFLVSFHMCLMYSFSPLEPHCEEKVLHIMRKRPEESKSVTKGPYKACLLHQSLCLLEFENM